MSSRSRKIARGLSAGRPVVFADAGPVIISGGVPLTLALRSDDGKATISLDDHSGPSVLVAEGTVPDMSRLYAEVCKDLARPGLRGRLAGIAAGAALGAVVGIAAAPWLPPTAAGDQPARQASLPAAEQAPLLPSLEDLRRIAEAAGTLPPSGSDASSEAGEGPTMTPILDLPDFLAPPGETEDDAAATAPEPEKAKGGPLFPTLPAGGLPAYVAAEPEAAPAEAAPAAQPEKAAPLPKDVPAPEEAAPEAAGPEEAHPEAAPETKGAENGAGDPPAVTEITPEQASQEAQQAARQLVAKGLTPEKALDVLNQLESLGRADLSEITPEMLAGLPHEVAQMLIDSGFVSLEDAPGGIPYRIIRLPESVVDSFRGPDGIASIPERNTWASTGNFVSIPLPGGGDIKTPDDLKDFHLQP